MVLHNAGVVHQVARAADLILQEPYHVPCTALLGEHLIDRATVEIALGESCRLRAGAGAVAIGVVGVRFIGYAGGRVGRGEQLTIRVVSVIAAAVDIGALRNVASGIKNKTIGRDRRAAAIGVDNAGEPIEAIVGVS